ncbi:MAG: histidine kinase [Clostridiales bacterium]|nr:histidine kinase [Candidatus Blautia equi]
MQKKRISLKWALMTTVLASWAAAVVGVIFIAGILINYNFSRNMKQNADADAERILNQIQIRVEDSMESSKKISYDGVIRNAHKVYQEDGDGIALYRSVNQYLSGSFSRDAKFKAVFITFWDEDITSRIYVINQKNNSYHILQQFISEVRPEVLKIMQDADTAIRFYAFDGDLYMSRNLLTAKFEPYATVTMLCDSSILFQPLLSLADIGETIISIGGNEYYLYGDGSVADVGIAEKVPQPEEFYSTDIDGQRFAYYIVQEPFHILTDLPGVRLAMLLAFLLVIPMLIILMSVFYKLVSAPVMELSEAYGKVQAGERGYEIADPAGSMEFQTLYGQFNTMSAELKSQFLQSQLEQQALQQAKIRALQSQINPHFLNNTLEVINWEARIAGDDQVSEMIEALSTMLKASLFRDGSDTVPLEREMDYVDAYLKIICKRLGNRLVIEKDIDPAVLKVQVPKLMLQPIVENAVEHDITPRRGGILKIWAGLEAGLLRVKIIHEGTLTMEDRQNIRELLDVSDIDLHAFTQEKGKHIGVRNVAMRLRLLYGQEGSLTIEEEEENLIAAYVTLPAKE